MCLLTRLFVRQLTLLVAAVVVFSGCSKMPLSAQSPIAASSAEPTFGPAKLTSRQVQLEVMTFADSFAAAMAQSWTEAAGSSAHPQAKLTALIRKLNLTRSAYSIASGPNPLINVADIITLATLQARTLEMPMFEETFGQEKVVQLRGVAREQEKQAWGIGSRVYTSEQQGQLKGLITTWLQENPDQLYISSVRLQDYASTHAVDSTQHSSSSGSLLSLVFLDPLAGLDPATQEIHKARLLAERMFYYWTRMPQLLSWEAQVTYTELAETDASVEVINSVSRISAASEEFARVAGELPEKLSEQTTKVLDDFVAKLDEGGEVNTTLFEFRKTAEETEKMARSVEAATGELNEFVARFTTPKDQPKPPSDKPKKDHLGDFGRTADQTGAAADRVTLLVQSTSTLIESIESLLASPSLKTQSSAFQGLTSEAQASGEKLIDRAFWRALVLVIIAPIVVSVCVLVCRRVLPRRSAE